MSNTINTTLYASGSTGKIHEPSCGLRSRRARAVRGTADMTPQEIVAAYQDRLCKSCCSSLVKAAQAEQEQESAQEQAVTPEVSATETTLEFLSTPEGKKFYKRSLEQARGGENRTDPLWDRFPGYALEEAHVRCGGGALDQDQIMDWFTRVTNSVDEYGDEIYTSSLPQFISLTKNISKLRDKLGHILDNDKDPNWGN